MFRPKSFGAVPHGDGTRFTLFAHGHETASVEIEGHGSFALEPRDGGYFEGDIPGIGPGARYRFRLDDGPALPDLASRFQPEGNDGPSEVVTSDFAWTDAH